MSSLASSVSSMALPTTPTTPSYTNMTLAMTTTTTLCPGPMFQSCSIAWRATGAVLTAATWASFCLGVATTLLLLLLPTLLPSSSSSSSPSRILRRPRRRSSQFTRVLSLLTLATLLLSLAYTASYFTTTTTTTDDSDSDSNGGGLGFAFGQGDVPSEVYGYQAFWFLVLQRAGLVVGLISVIWFVDMIIKANNMATMHLDAFRRRVLPMLYIPIAINAILWLTYTVLVPLQPWKPADYIHMHSIRQPQSLSQSQQRFNASIPAWGQLCEFSERLGLASAVLDVITVALMLAVCLWALRGLCRVRDDLCRVESTTVTTATMQKHKRLLSIIKQEATSTAAAATTNNQAPNIQLVIPAITSPAANPSHLLHSLRAATTTLTLLSLSVGLLTILFSAALVVFAQDAIRTDRQRDAGEWDTASYLIDAESSPASSNGRLLARCIVVVLCVGLGQIGVTFWVFGSVLARFWRSGILCRLLIRLFFSTPNSSSNDSMQRESPSPTTTPQQQHHTCPIAVALRSSTSSIVRVAAASSASVSTRPGLADVILGMDAFEDEFFFIDGGRDGCDRGGGVFDEDDDSSADDVYDERPKENVEVMEEGVVVDGAVRLKKIVVSPPPRAHHRTA